MLVMIWTKRIGAAFLLLLGAYIALLAFPQPLFGHSLSYGRYDIRSDRPIDPAIRLVLNDAERRLRTSDLLGNSDRFRIFICNEPWRLRLFTLSTQTGGVTDGTLTRNIFLREVHIASNRLVPPSGELADAAERPLSYFIAHEAVHVMQSRAFGRPLALRYPPWLKEGHADLVAKGGAFAIQENLRLLAAGDPRLDPAQSGLYRRYHLMVAYLLAQPGVTTQSLFANPPDEAAVLARLRQVARRG